METIENELKIIDSIKNVQRVRITYIAGLCNIAWPNNVDIEENDRKTKIHDSIIRYFECDNDFKDNTLFLKTNIQIERIDKFQYVDLKWEAVDTRDSEDIQHNQGEF